jgi:hypothetical protein
MVPASLLERLGQAAPLAAELEIEALALLRLAVIEPPALRRPAARSGPESKPEGRRRLEEPAAVVVRSNLSA